MGRLLTVIIRFEWINYIQVYYYLSLFSLLIAIVNGIRTAFTIIQFIIEKVVENCQHVVLS